MEDLLGRHTLQIGDADSFDLICGDNRIVIEADSGKTSCFRYKRHFCSQLISEAMILSEKESVTFGIFPVPALLTPKPLAKSVYLKFKYPLIIDQKSDAIFYTKMPIELAIYRQHIDEEMLIDVFSTQKLHYSLYGSPESGVVCRYQQQVDVSPTRGDIKPAKYKEALVRLSIHNNIDNIVKINEVVIPMYNVVLDHIHDESELPGSVDMSLDQAFSKDVVNVLLVNTKVKRTDKTSAAGKLDSLTFLMDSGY